MKTLVSSIKNHWQIVSAIVLVYILDVIVVIKNPITSPIPEIATTYTLFSFSLQGCILINGVGLYLLYRWFKTGRNNPSTFSFAIGFLCYGSLLIGLIFQALGYPWANMNDFKIFFLWRQGMIIWSALMYYGLSLIMIKSKKLQLIPTILILLIGYYIYYHGLIIHPDINAMMYVFLYSIFIPVCILNVYLFWKFGKSVNMSGPKIISIGFVVLAFTYLMWSSTHSSYNYWIIFATFNLSNSMILFGFLLLPYETRIKALESGENPTNDKE